MIKKNLFFLSVMLILAVFVSLGFVSAAYVADVYFTAPNTVYAINESIELLGYVYQTNLSVTNISSAFSGAVVNLTIIDANSTVAKNYTFVTDSNGAFYSYSNYYTSATQITAPSNPGTYSIRAEYKDPLNTTWFSEVEVSVINQTIDLLSVSSDKAKYSPSGKININVEAIRRVGDRILYVSNVSINGSLRSSAKTYLQAFNCTTSSNGKCTINTTAPAHGNYLLELKDFKAFSSFSVVPFSYSVYMKDELGKWLKNVFALGEQARVEVKIANASDPDKYSFSGYILDSSGNVIKSINSTALTGNNSFTNSFLFTIDAIQFSYGAYSAYIVVTKTGDGSINSSTSFQVKNWVLTINKKTINSGFEYEYSTFPNQTLRFEALPTYRLNGSIISDINSSSFTISLKDNLNNIVSSANTSWNTTCGTSGCYEFSLSAPLNTGQYTLHVTLSYSGSVQTEARRINVIGGVMSAQSTDKDGSIKDLFGTNEYAYLTLSSYNLTNSQFNLTDAEIYLVSYMNGSELSYTGVNNFDLVNASNSIYEWAWNSSSQRIKLDVPKFGGVYNVFIFGDNRTLGAIAKFIINPYDMCYAAKNTAGTVDYSTSYYVWQFKTSDTVYFELKITQANNPLGKATASNVSGNGSAGLGAKCNIDTQTKQVISNATITIAEVKNLESGTLQNVNMTGSTCQSSDSSGGYTCTLKPLTKWDGGQNIVKFNIVSQDGTSTDAYSRFEARAFYLYGYTQQYQNNPSSNISLILNIYEAGTSWWSGGGSSGGLSGTVTVKKVEYQGRDGEWLPSPVDSGYNTSALNSSTITNGYNTLKLPAQYATSGAWKTGYYRVILQATTSSGDTDYGYAWFGIKLWDVYGYPIDCSSIYCNYKSYFNSKENITLYININKAGTSWWSSGYQGGQEIYGNVTVGIKRIQNCKTWPCKDLNSSDYTANSIVVNVSSPGYWNANLNNQSGYMIQINKTTGSWGTGYYSVTLDVNGTDTGSAWFNTIAFYIETQPSNSNGSQYKYSIKPSEKMYFNITSTRNYKWWSSYWNGSQYISTRYNLSDYVNVTVDDAVLRVWDQETYQSKEYNYPENINITPTSINGSSLINITFLNGSWPSGYYWGELTLKNSENETSSGYLWFNVQPFRVQMNTVGNAWEMDEDQCVNATLNIYDPDWYSSALLYGNYSIVQIYENIWGGYGSIRFTYTNYTVNSYVNNSFNATANISICPNNGSWGSGSWGGYHYPNVLVKDNSDNSTQTGWIYFRAVPFKIRWIGGGGNKLTNEDVVSISVNLSKASTGAAASGNLTKLYQQRYDNYLSTRENYVFKIGNCYSNVSGQCNVTGTQNITIYAPSGGWKVGYNYLQTEWTKQTDSSSTLQDYSGVYFEGREAYNGWFENYDANYNWKYYLAANENITIKLNVRDSSYNSNGINVSITNVWYAYFDNCWSEYCRSYTEVAADAFSPNVTSNGVAVLNIRAPSSNWSRGYYAIKAKVSGSAGYATITGGTVKVKDMTPTDITINTPTNNATYNSTILFSVTTSKNAQCSINIISYSDFYSWYCGSWNATNSTAASIAQKEGACNSTRYGYSGSSYYSRYISKDYHSVYNITLSSYCYSSGGVSTCYGTDSSRLASYITTGGTTHLYSLNLTGVPSQHYGLVLWCYDEDYNYASALAAFKVNVTTSNATAANQTTNLSVTIISPAATAYPASSVDFNISSNVNLSSCRFTINNWSTNYTMTINSSLRGANYTNSSIADGNYTARFWCNDTNNNVNNTATVIFVIDTTYPLINYSAETTVDYANLTQNSIFANVSITETNFKNITFLLWNSTARVNLTTYTSLTKNINWTSLPYTNYTFNVSIYDLAGNFNITATRHVNLSIG